MKMFPGLKFVYNPILSFSKLYVPSFTQIFRSVKCEAGKIYWKIAPAMCFNVDNIHGFLCSSTFFCSLPSENVSPSFRIP